MTAGAIVIEEACNADDFVCGATGRESLTVNPDGTVEHRTVFSWER